MNTHTNPFALAFQSRNAHLHQDAIRKHMQAAIRPIEPSEPTQRERAYTDARNHAPGAVRLPEVLRVLKQRGRATAQEIATDLGVNLQGVRTCLTKKSNAHLFVRVGDFVSLDSQNRRRLVAIWEATQ